MSLSRPLIPALSALALVVATALFALRPAARELRGDEATFVAMAASLARDFDLEFGAADLEWAKAHEGVALILERNGSGATARLAYSKPILYPLLAAPLALLLGDWGAALLNLLALAAAFAVAARCLVLPAGDADERGARRDTLLTFALTGLVLVYAAWRMTESLQLALALAGLALTFAALRGANDGVRGDWIGAVLLGLMVALREPNALVAAAPVAAALWQRDFRRAVRFALAIAVSYAAVVGLTWAMTGAPNPYKAPRATFNAETGFPVGPDAAAPLARFDSVEELATSTLAAVPEWNAGRSAYAALYFLVGRHTGLLWYLPATALLFFCALGSADRAGRAALAAFAALALFYIVWMPANYFGGETFVGNRYILAGAALPLVALGRWPRRRTLLFAWAIAALVAASAALSIVRTRAVDATSQSHASAGIFRLLPYESTASNLDGRRDRYWAGDFVRFVDPFAVADPWSFTLAAGAPPAELEIATRWREAPLHLLVHADAPEATLEISDWRHRERFRLAPLGDGRSGGPVRFTPAPEWRRHRFWWNSNDAYAVRMLRFRVTSGNAVGGAPVEMRLRYLGRNEAPATGFERDVVRVDLAGTAVAGAASEVAIEVVNRGDFVWTSEAALAVQLGLRFVPLDGGSQPIEARRPLPGAVRPGERLATTVRVDWPERRGRYRVTLDLVLEDVAWFEEKVGAPLARAEIDVLPAPR